MKRKRYVRYAIIFALVLISAIRIAYVNRNNAQGKNSYISDTETVEYNGIQYTVTDEVLYEMPAFVEKYPQIQEYYMYNRDGATGRDNEETLRGLKYVLCISLQFKNSAIEDKTIDLTDYRIFGKVHSDGIDPFCTATLNNCESVINLPAGGQRTILLPYNMYQQIFREKTYKNLLNEPFSVMVSGYPNMQYISLKQLHLVKSAGKFDPFALKGQGGSKVEDTKQGTVVEPGEEMIENSIGATVLDVNIVKNIKKYKEFKKECLEGSVSVKKDGTVLPSEECWRREGQEYYMVFIKVKMHNYWQGSQEMYTAFNLYPNYKDDDDNVEMSYYSCDYTSSEDKRAYFGTIQENEDKVITLGYLLGVPRKTDITKKDLYLNLNGGKKERYKKEPFNLRKGETRGYTYMRVQ